LPNLHLLSSVESSKSIAMTVAIGFNQIIDSNISIPGAIPADPIVADARTLRIILGPEQTESDFPIYARTDDALLFNAPNVALYNCRPDVIEVGPYPEADPEWVSALLIATAMPAAFWMQGSFVLHAAAVVLNGASHAIAIAGAGGAGKSTLARQLLEQGARLLADDSVALETTELGIMASGLPGGIHLQTGDGENRSFEPVTSERSARSAPLGAIVVLDGFAADFESTALSKISALEKIIAHRHRPRIPAALGRSGTVLAQAARIAECIPVTIWRRREGAFTISEMEQAAFAAMLQAPIS
jgi:hypothetical protein